MMIKEGALENPNVDAVFGLHVISVHGRQCRATAPAR